MMRSFYIRLSALFLLLMIGLTLVVGWQSLNAALEFVDESEQKLNQDLAQVMAVDFQPFLVDSIDHAMIREKIELLIGINPRIDIYLLGSTGMIKALFIESGQEPVQRVLDVEPMNRMMAGESLPILADDPLEIGGMKPFSVAPLEIMGEKGCYLYIVLGSERYDSIAAMVRDSYIMRTLARSLGIVALIGALVGLLLFAFITRRLRNMNQVVADFAKGEYGNRIEKTSSDEFGQLATTFNQMADTIEANIEKLQQNDQLRRELIANVSHDLRGPLASIQGYLETILMKKDEVDKEQLIQYVETGLANTQKLNKLVSELFELSKLDAKQVQLQAEKFSVSDLVQDVAAQFKPEAEAAQVRLELDLTENAPMVYGDIALVERAISNLIDNAIRYTPAGGEVRIIPTINGDGVGVTVADTGVGIAPDHLPRIFDRFFRADESRAADYGGAGLGLAIAKKIVELHNSTLLVDSIVNQGTTFSFTLPFRKAALVN